MKKKKLIAIINQQSQTINKLEKVKVELEKENKYLRDNFEESRDFIIATIDGIVWGAK
ncbi:MAG: hypothetical protein GQ570_11940 [Helicobacteraceae bacterium]|nr:hypothetical protein [Helicobacteraceae bacterium]